MDAHGQVVKLDKSGGYYDVVISFGFQGVSFEKMIVTEETDPNAAINVARQWLYDFGAALSKTFQNNGDLK